MAPITKKRRYASVEEITFDESAREQYLTGFHKRKQQRIKHAQEIAAKRERDERIVERRQMREQRQRQLEEHIEKVNSMLHDTNGTVDSNEENEGEESTASTEGEWGGFEEPLEVNRVDEYIDEDKYAMVTVESVDVSKDGLHATVDEEEAAADGTQSSDGKEKVSSNDISIGKQPKKGVWTKEKPGGKKSKKKKKFRYESVAERKAARQKQKAKNVKAAKARRGG